MGRGTGKEETRPLPRRSQTTVATLIDAGVLSAGQNLHATFIDRRTRSLRRVEAELVDRGRVRVLSDGDHGDLDGCEFTSPSAAITALFGRADSGWTNWKIERDGGMVLLQEVRKRFDHEAAS